MQALQNRGSLASTRAAGVPTPRGLTVVRAGKTDDIYIGFKKEEGFGDRTGKKGRVIKDDPSKYPNKEDAGPLIGVVGGWAGGEAGLWKLREEIKKNDGGKPSKPAPRNMVRGPAKPGKDEIYVGFGKEPSDFEARKAGAKGRVIYDDAYKYPNKEDMGPLLGATGGFAGGEVGLKNFASTGELRVRRPGEPGPRQFTPVTFAFLMAFAGLIGGAVLAVAGIN